MTTTSVFWQPENQDQALTTGVVYESLKGFGPHLMVVRCHTLMTNK